MPKRKRVGQAPRGYKKRKFSARKRSKTFAKRVTKIIQKQEEKKHTEFGAQNAYLTVYPSIVYAYNNYNNIILTPSSGYTITQGAGVNQRIGNKIKVVKAMLKLIFYPTVYDATNNPAPQPQDLRIIIAHNKNSPTAGGNVDSNFFDVGNSTAAPTGNLLDMLTPINKDVWVVSRDFRTKVGSAIDTGTGSSAPAQYFANNDYKYNVIKNVDVTKAFPSHITWNDTTTTPTSFAVQLIMLASQANGGAPANALPLQWAWYVKLTYTDD